jgi:two-component system phosphate regulon response regulator PhoB
MSDKQNILVVDDEPAIREMVGFALSRAGFNVEEAADSREAIAQITNNPPNLVLLDWMLPDISGVDLARRLKKDELTSNLPIIMLTARSEEHDKIRGLEIGADDYVIKPFSPRELIARINAVLRRVEPHSDKEILEAENLRLDPVSHRISVDDQPVDLGPTEFRLLYFFMTNPERVYSRSQLLDRVWGQNVYIEERTVDVHIRRLRKVLAEFNCDKMVQTVRGAGYRFSTQI